MLSGFGPRLFGGWPSTQCVRRAQKEASYCKPLVVFFSPVRFFKKPKLARGLFELADSLTAGDQVPLLSVADTNPAELPQQLLLISEMPSDGSRVIAEHGGYSAGMPGGE